MSNNISSIHHYCNTLQWCASSSLTSCENLLKKIADLSLEVFSVLREAFNACICGVSSYCFSKNSSTSGNSEIDQALDEWVNSITWLDRVFVWPKTLEASIKIKEAFKSNEEKLYLSHLNLISLPTCMANLSSVRLLDLSHNRLTKLAPEIGKLKKLQYLFLANNQLTTLPNGIFELETLESLDLSHNKLTTIQAQIEKLKALEWLNLEDNKLKNVSSETFKLKALQYLLLNRNDSLVELPVRRDEITKSLIEMRF